MKTRARIFIAALTAMATMAGLASCAHSQPEPGYPVCTENEIVTYEPTDTTKTVITIGRYTIFNSEPLQKALSERIPEASFAFVDAPGTNDVRAYVKEQAERNDLPDLVFSGMRVGSGEYAYDLSAEGFTGRYNLSSLEKLSVDGTLRQLPINSSVKGIFYNKTLFEEHGWEIPATLTEFYDLCDAITAEGIRPFVPCLKYSVQDVGLGLTSRSAPRKNALGTTMWSTKKPRVRGCLNRTTRFSSSSTIEGSWWKAISRRASPKSARSCMPERSL